MQTLNEIMLKEFEEILSYDEIRDQLDDIDIQMLKSIFMEFLKKKNSKRFDTDARAIINIAMNEIVQ